MAAVRGPGRVEVKLFGPLSVIVGTRTLGPSDFGGVKPKQLLEILLARRGRTVDKAALADLLWSDRPPLHPAAAVEHCVCLVRSTLSRHDPRMGRRLLVTEPAGYRFAAGQAVIDLDQFDHIMAGLATARTTSARQRVQQALALAGRGEVLEDERHARWAESLRVTYRARLLTVRLEAAEVALADSDYDEALSHALAAVDLDAFEERGYRLLMIAQYAVGRQHDALTTFASLRSRLRDELGLEPTPQAAALQTAVLRQVDVGSLIPRTRRRPSLAALPGVPLLGRVDELATLDAAVDEALSGSAGLIMVDGPSGIGKTRLLDEFVRRQAGTVIGRATCWQLQRRLPFVALAATLRDVFGTRIRSVARAQELATVLPELAPRRRQEPFRRLHVLEAVVDLARTHAPMVLVFDEFHWADPDSVAALSYLVSRGSRLPLAIVAALDSERVSRASPIRGLPASLVLTLGPLVEDDLATLVVPGLYARTGGHPALITAELGRPARGRATTLGQSHLHLGPTGRVVLSP